MSAEPPGGSGVSDLTTIEAVGAKIAASPSCGDMAIDVGVTPGPERTRALLVEIAGGRRGVQLRGQVAAAKRGATREQIEEAFQEACLKAGRSCRGQTMGEVYKWLLKTTDSIVDDMRDRLKREVLVDHCATEFQTVDPTLVPPDEVLIKREERAELDELTLAILERLDERKRRVAVLHSHGLARDDIARQLGITARIVKRDVEGILAAGREQLARVVGTGCPDGHQLVSRYAFGLAAGREARRAQLHLASCARCGAMFERLELWRERVAAVVPMPPAVGGAGAHRRTCHRMPEATSWPPRHVQPRPAGLREHVAHAIVTRARAGDGRVLPHGGPNAARRCAARRGRDGRRRLSCHRRRSDVLRAAGHRPDHRLHRLCGHRSPRAQAEAAAAQARACRAGRCAASGDADRRSAARTPNDDGADTAAADDDSDDHNDNGNGNVGAAARAAGSVRADVARRDEPDLRANERF